MTIYALLKPFRYTYPLIFNLPELLIPLCDAPGGVLIGINQGVDYLQAEELHKIYTECIFVVLEEPKIILFTASKLSIVEPNFGSLKQKVALLYSDFNSAPGRKIEYGVAKKMVESKSALLATPKTPTTSHTKKLSNNIPKQFTGPNRSDNAQCEKIMKLFHDAFIENIIKHIPKDPIYTIVIIFCTKFFLIVNSFVK